MTQYHNIDVILQGCKAFTVVCELNQSYVDLLVKISLICVMLSHFSECICLNPLFACFVLPSSVRCSSKITFWNVCCFFQRAIQASV